MGISYVAPSETLSADGIRAVEAVGNISTTSASEFTSWNTVAAEPLGIYPSAEGKYACMYGGPTSAGTLAVYGATGNASQNGCVEANIAYGVSGAKFFVYDNASEAQLIVDEEGIRLPVNKTPASASDTGVKGNIAWDTSYIYVCTATNTWKRAALSTW